MSPHGHAVPPDGCPKGRSTAPAGCAAGSRMTIHRFGISGRLWMQPSNCWKSSNFSHEKTLPGRGWQIPAAPGQEAFLTPYLTTVRAGTRGNSGFKSVKKYRILSRKTPKSTTNYHKKFGSSVWEQDAAGSNPVTRTTFLRKTACLGGFSSFCKTATTGYARGSKKGMPIRRKDKPPSVE